MTDRKNGLTYADSGVDIDAGNRLVDLIKPMVRATARAGADAEIGGFGGLFDLKAAGFKDPVLVAATDGVGTKVKIAIETGLHGGIGIDLVAMSVNDLVVQGAELARHVEALGEEAVDGIAEAGDEENRERDLHLARHDGPDDDRDQHDAAQGDDIRNTHVALPGTRSDLESGPLGAEPVVIYIV